MSSSMTKVGVIGAGYWAQNMLRSIADSPHCELTYICDLSSEAREAVAKRYLGVTVTDSVDQILNDPTVDAVYIATPPFTHEDLAKRALSAGKHVLVEKPLTTSGAGAADLIELADLKQKTLMVGHTFLYSSPVLKVRELVETNELGDIFYIDSARVNLGKYQKSGVLWDLAPHDLSIIFFWLNEAPSGVSAIGRSFRSDTREDVAFLNLDFPSGAIAQVHVSWLAPAKMRRTTLSGSKKMAVYDDLAGSEALKIYDQGVDVRNPETFGEYQLTYREGDISIPRLDNNEPLRTEWEHFLTCIKTGESPRSNGAHGLWVVKTLEAADAALRSNKRESIEWSTPSRTATRRTKAEAR